MLQRVILQFLISAFLSTSLKAEPYEPTLPYIEGISDVFCPDGHICRFFYVTYVPPYIFNKEYMDVQHQGILDDPLLYCANVFIRLRVDLGTQNITLTSKSLELQNPYYALECARAFTSSELTVQFSPPFKGESKNMDTKTKTSGDRLEAYVAYMDVSYIANARLRERYFSIFVEMQFPRLPMEGIKEDCCEAKHYLSTYMTMAFIESCALDCDRAAVYSRKRYFFDFPSKRPMGKKANLIKWDDGTIKPFSSIYPPFDVPPRTPPKRPKEVVLVNDDDDDDDSAPRKTSKKKKEPNWYLCFVILGVLFLLLAVISIFAIILLFLIHADRKRVQKAVAKRSVQFANEERDDELLLLDAAVTTEPSKDAKSPSKKMPK
uniref:Uncharacterized protein n=1 Tax=Panagrellus redivivus TaxID=6233 RepID=A0A7E4VU69_PANRE